jgi:hypothetical protein
VSAPSPRAVRHDRSIFVAYAVMLAIPLLLLRVPVLGNGTWIGNPDRLNNQLKLLLFYVRGIASENLAAWNEHEMLGFDSFVMPAFLLVQPPGSALRSRDLPSCMRKDG